MAITLHTTTSYNLDTDYGPISVTIRRPTLSEMASLDCVFIARDKRVRDIQKKILAVPGVAEMARKNREDVDIGSLPAEVFDAAEAHELTIDERSSILAIVKECVKKIDGVDGITTIAELMAADEVYAGAVCGRIAEYEWDDYRNRQVKKTQL